MNDVTNLFCSLVQIDSISGEETQMIAHVSRFVREQCKLDPRVDRHGNVFIQTQGVGSPLLLGAHLDTVEPGRGIVPQIADGVITSKGKTILAADNKAAVAAILTALKAITSDPNKSWRPLDILFTTSEEKGCYGAIGFDTRMLRANIGVLFDGTGPVGTLMTASPYYARFNVKLVGKSAHAGYPEKATPVLPDFIALTQRIEKLRTKNALVTIGTFTGGTARNTVAGRAAMKGEIRSFSENVFHTTIEKLRTIFSLTYSCELEAEVVIENPGYTHSPKEIRLIQNLIEDILGRTSTSKKSFGVSDANIFNQTAGLTVFNLGDGSAHAHTTRESIPVVALNEMENCILSLADASIRLEITKS